MVGEEGIAGRENVHIKCKGIGLKGIISGVASDENKSLKSKKFFFSFFILIFLLRFFVFFVRIFALKKKKKEQFI